jgi:hypothetical protein
MFRVEAKLVLLVASSAHYLILKKYEVSSSETDTFLPDCTVSRPRRQYLQHRLGLCTLSDGIPVHLKETPKSTITRRVVFPLIDVILILMLIFLINKVTFLKKYFISMKTSEAIIN